MLVPGPWAARASDVTEMSKSASADSETDVLGSAAGLTAARRRFAFVIVVEAQGSTSARAGAEAPQVVDITLDDEVLATGMPCGGQMRIYVEHDVPRPTLWSSRS